LNHRTLPEFWHHYRRIPKDIQELADKNFALLKANPRHPNSKGVHHDLHSSLGAAGRRRV